jgi:hypothetical protein
MTVVARLLMMFLAYVLACIAASAVFTFGMLALDWNDLSSTGLPPAAGLVIVVIVAAIIGVIAALPTALIVVIAEAFAWRSVLFYAALGGALALILSYGLDVPKKIGQSDTFFLRELQLLAASGIAGGFVYWLFAGGSVGAWRVSA